MVIRTNFSFHMQVVYRIEIWMVIYKKTPSFNFKTVHFFYFGTISFPDQLNSFDWTFHFIPWTVHFDQRPITFDSTPDKYKNSFLVKQLFPDYQVSSEFWLNQLWYYLNLKPMQLKISDNLSTRKTTRYRSYILMNFHSDFFFDNFNFKLPLILSYRIRWGRVVRMDFGLI